ncbi:MAG: glycosyltransferase family 1 protein [Actinomycetales bacterium]|nr:glycosyltransferase family 1 protein [Actinomycetales bacterium]
MRVAIVAESFLPHVTGVSNSVLRVAEHLERRRIPAMIIAPGSRRGAAPETYAGAEIHYLSSLPMPGYSQVRAFFPRTNQVRRLLRSFGADVVHLASPFLSGPAAVRAARSLGIPTIAVYQTDLPGFVARYGLGFSQAWIWRRLRATHAHVQRTLAPSSAAVAALGSQGIPRIATWARGVDARRFHPCHRDDALRRELAPHGEVLVGFIGRLAPEKCAEDLAILNKVPGLRLVIIGDGPRRASLERLLPGAAFLGFLSGGRLPAAMASLDVAVHTGPHETFCQSLQESLACGVPSVAVDAGGPRDLIQPSYTGWLYPPGQLNVLRAHVMDLAGDLSKARAMGAAARQSVLGRTWERINDELLGHYEAVQDITFRRQAA